MVKLIIFDLDGTLLNTLDDLADCTNFVLQQNGYPTHEIEAYKYFVGNGVEMLLHRALPKEITENEFTKIFNGFMNYYELHKADKTAPYEGMIETLEELQKQGIFLAVATNKPHHLLPELMQFYFPTIKWAAVFGNRKDVPIKPHPQIVYDILSADFHRLSQIYTNNNTNCPKNKSAIICENLRTKITSKDVLYIGDTDVDMQTAQNAGITKIGVLWGFRTKKELEEAGADYLIEQPEELFNMFDKR